MTAAPPQRDGPPAVECAGITKRFGSVVALDEFALTVSQGTILSLLGPSGCGKTTALRIVAGFEDPDAGSVTIAGQQVVGPRGSVPPERRRVGMVFQDYALFPHMTVSRNVGYGVPNGQTRGRIADVIGLVGLEGLEDRMPHELSGGEQQRVALARALAPSPQLILLDEPFSNLDAPQRDRMRRDVRGILNAAGATAVFVTHDQEEALALADVVAVMRGGRVLQTASPPELYRSPADAWIANFVGESDFVDGTAEAGMVTTGLGTFPIVGPHRGEVRVMIRPEWVHPTPDQDGVGVVVDHEFYGHDQVVLVELPGGQRLRSRVGANPIYAKGDRVSIGIDEIVVYPKG